LEHRQAHLLWKSQTFSVWPTEQWRDAADEALVVLSLDAVIDVLPGHPRLLPMMTDVRNPPGPMMSP
jgi:hypothetical protein